MNITNFVERVLIIDNKEEESTPLKKLFESIDIDVTVFNPANEDEPRLMFKTRQLIFVDLLLDENITLAKSNLSRLSWYSE